ncbi:MAG: glycosyltransferase [Candidatus Gracilibacteria bacterium]|nr:glycosyltransferase [Candidatus Gracilibacteria bacterium]
MKKIALTGGGTGGHIFPLLSIYNYFKDEKKYEFIWFGDEEQLEAEIAFENNIKFIDIPSGKVRRYFDIRNFFEPLKNISGIFWGIYYILKNDVDIIFSKGGYVSLPVCIASFLLRKKIYIHESDAVSGITNNLISKLATKVFYTFPNEKIDSKKHILVGQILNPDLLENIENNEIEENEKLEILVIAGSQGSTIIFENIKTILNNLIDINFTIILGDKNLHFRSEFEKFNNVKIYDFVSQKELGEIYKKTDIAISRGGATTLWELYYFGIHSIIIPLKGSAQDHQMENAKYFNNEFGSILLEESGELNLNIFRLLTKYKDLRKSGLNLKGFYDSLKKIKTEIN